MPTYEYTCEACGNGWEATQRMSESALKDCPKCGQPKAKRLISAGNFLLKGDGWYKDLYHKPAAKKSSGESSSSGDSSSSSSPTASSTSGSTAPSSSASGSSGSSGSSGGSST